VVSRKGKAWKDKNQERRCRRRSRARLDRAVRPEAGVAHLDEPGAAEIASGGGRLFRSGGDGQREKQCQAG
jgi:hypothetical protein